jgi:GTP-binding protein
MSKEGENIGSNIPEKTPPENIRNLAVVAHVDHGKTTIVDCLLKAAMKLIIENRLLDNDDVERKRGITIFAKATSVYWRNKYLINITDTPGHSDFSAQVENSLKTVDAVLLVVDVNGMEQQTRFVIKKAIKANLKVMILINKLDRAPAEIREERAQQTVDEVLMYILEVDDSIDPFGIPVLYGSGKFNYASRDLALAASGKAEGVEEILDVIADYVPAPKVNPEEPARMLVTGTSHDQHLGRCFIGRAEGRGFCKNDVIYVKNGDGEELEKAKIQNIVRFVGVQQVHISRCEPGSIVGLYAGCKIGTVGHTVCQDRLSEPIEAPQLEKKVISVNVSANKFKPGSYGGSRVTFREISKRLVAEASSNVSIDAVVRGSEVEVSAMGALQLGILFDNMVNKEGYELVISASKIQTIMENGVEKEPFEKVNLEFSVNHMGKVMNSINQHGGMVEESDTFDENMKIVFLISSRNLLGFGSKFKSITKGAGIMGREIFEYRKMETDARTLSRSNGLLIACEDGKASSYGIYKRLKLGSFFIEPGEMVKKGQIVGESNNESSMSINVVESKKLTNIRAAGSDEKTSVPETMPMPMEAKIIYIQGEEKIFATPMSVAIMSK